MAAIFLDEDKTTDDGDGRENGKKYSIGRLKRFSVLFLILHLNYCSLTDSRKMSNVLVSLFIFSSPKVLHLCFVLRATYLSPRTILKSWAEPTGKFEGLRAYCGI